MFFFYKKLRKNWKNNFVSQKVRYFASIYRNIFCDFHGIFSQITDAVFAKFLSITDFFFTFVGSGNLLQISCFHGTFVGNASFYVFTKKKNLFFFADIYCNTFKKNHYWSCVPNFKNIEYIAPIQKKYGFSGISENIGWFCAKKNTFFHGIAGLNWEIVFLPPQKSGGNHVIFGEKIFFVVKIGFWEKKIYFLKNKFFFPKILFFTTKNKFFFPKITWFPPLFDRFMGEGGKKISHY